MYEQDVYLGYFELLLIPNDEVPGEINHLRSITENNCNRFCVQ